MDTTSAIKKHNKAYEIIAKRYPSFMRSVLLMGQVKWTDQLPTAAVAASPGKEDLFHFLANPEFVDKCSDEEWAGVVAHETLHIVLSHLILQKHFKNKMKFNIAADCVINDYLISQGASLPAECMFGKDVVGYECTHRSVRDVYKAIPDDSKYSPMDSHDFWDGLSEEQQKQLIDQIKDEIKEAVGRGESVPKELREAANAKGAMESARGFTRGVASERVFAATSNTSIAWARLLRHIDPAIIRDFKGREPEKPRSFYRQNYATSGIPTDARLPTRYNPSEDMKKGNEKHQIVLVIDSSGSVTDEQRRKFIALAQSLPKHLVNVYAFEFNTITNVIDIDNPVLTTGGTEFSIIQDHIVDAIARGELKSYPKAVVIITDGQADFSHARPNKMQEKAWHWLLDGALAHAPKQFAQSFGGAAYNLKNFVVGE